MVLDLNCLCAFEALDRRAGRLVRTFADVMGLRPEERAEPKGRVGRFIRVSHPGHTLKIHVDPPGETFEFPDQSCEDGPPCGAAGCEPEIKSLVALSLVVAAQSQARGGVLAHGALAERDDMGVLLLGPSGRGKSTASRRLMPPWRSLSDDTAIAVPGTDGRWRAHPWPTWSRFSNGGRGGSWDVGKSVDLAGLFFLSWSSTDRVEPVGAGRAACLLVEAFEQAWRAGDGLFAEDVLKRIRARAFENISDLVKSVPAHLLHISPGGPFWEKIEEALDEARCAV